MTAWKRTYTVEVYLVVDESEPEWSPKRIQGSCPMFSLAAESQSEGTVLNHLKGSVLCAIGMRPELPDEITVDFSINRSRRSE